MIARIRLITFFALLATLLGCAGSQPRPEWASAPDANLPAQSTFGWASVAGDGPRSIRDTRVRDALRAELISKGYAESADSPDFLIGYQFIAYEPGQRSSPVRIGLGVGSWGGNVGGSVGTSVGVGGRGEPDLQNRLTIRALDVEEQSELWIGTSTSFDAFPEEGAVERVVSGVMRGFPAKGN